MARASDVRCVGGDLGDGARSVRGVLAHGPSVVFFVALALSMAGLAYAMRSLPTGTSYAVWVGVGAALTVAYGMVTGTDAVSLVKVALLAGLIVCIVGLRLVG